MEDYELTTEQLADMEKFKLEHVYIKDECKILHELLNELCQLPESFRILTKNIEINCPPNVPGCKDDPAFILQQSVLPYLAEYLMYRGQKSSQLILGFYISLVEENKKERYYKRKIYDPEKAKIYDKRSITQTNLPQIANPSVTIVKIIVPIFSPEEKFLKSHVTMLLANNKNRTVEYFDSNGPGYTEYFDIVQDKAREIATELFSGYTFVPMNDFCQMNMGPQVVGPFEPKPYCSYYQLLHAYLMLYCPNLSSEKIIDIIAEYKDYPMEKDPVDGFICYLIILAIKTGILELWIKWSETKEQKYMDEIKKIILPKWWK